MFSEFIYKYYINPIRYGEAYNVVDTLTYAAILVVAIYLIYRWMKRTNMTLDAAFVLATLPFVVLGGLLRVVQDTGMIEGDLQFLLVTPLIYFVLGIFTIVTLVIAKLLEHKGLVRSYIPVYGGTGIAGCLVVGAILLAFGFANEIHPEVFLAIMGMAIATSAALYAVMRYGLKWAYVVNPLYLALIFGQLLDASATSYGIDLHPLNYTEVHVVGGNLIALTGTAFVMFPLKLAVLFPAIWILEMYRKEESGILWHLVILAMIVVGLAPGIRDMVRMVLYV